VKAHNSRRAVFSAVRAARAARQLCGNHISAAVSQHAIIEEAVFSVWVAPRLYNEDLTQLELLVELSCVPELAVGRIMARKEFDRANKILCVI
jgi:dephospho-CoA kinase